MLLADDFYEGAFATAPVEFTVEDLFPRPQVELAYGDGDDDFAAHDLAFQVGVRVIFAGAIVPVSVCGRVRRKFFQPDFVIVVEPTLIVVDEDGRGDVHGVDQAKAFAHPALANELFDLRRDVDEPAPAGDFKPEILRERFQSESSLSREFGKRRVTNLGRLPDWQVSVTAVN